jgi:hypothetical protein
MADTRYRLKLRNFTQPPAIVTCSSSAAPRPNLTKLPPLEAALGRRNEWRLFKAAPGRSVASAPNPKFAHSCCEDGCELRKRGTGARERIAQFEVAGRPQPSGLNTRTVEGGLLASFDGGRIGRATKFPPQFGQRPPSRLSTQSRQNVHSNEQIIASVADGGKSLLQHSQLGRSSSI